MTDILTKAKDGDQFAIEELMNSYKPMLKSMCRRFFLVGLDEDDLMQETMLAMFKAINTYDFCKNDNFTNYAYKIISNRLLSVVRTNNSKKYYILNAAMPLNIEGGLELNIKNDFESQLIVAIDDKNFEEDLMSKDSLKTVNNIIRELISKEDYDILLLYLSGYKYNEIADKTHSNTKYIDNRIQKIKQLLIKNKEKIFKGE